MQNLLAVILLLLVPTQGVVARRPDFSGYWTVDEPVKAITGPLGSALAIAQVGNRLTIDLVNPSAGEKRLVYNIDGEARADYPVPPPRTPSMAGRELLLFSDVLGRVSRAAWMGDQLLIVTHTRKRLTIPGVPPTEHELQETERRTFAIEGGRLIFESQVWLDPPPYGSSGREPWPGTWRATFTRAMPPAGQSDPATTSPRR